MTKNRKAQLGLIFVAIIWGSSFVFIRDLKQNMTDAQIVFARFAVSFLILGTVILLNKSEKNETLNYQQGFVAGVLLFLLLYSTTFLLKYITASAAGFFTGLGVVWVAIFMGFAKRKFTLRLGAVIVISLIGISLLSLTNAQNFKVTDLSGIILSFIAGGQILYLERVSDKNPVFKLTFMQFAVATLITLIVGFNDVININQSLVTLSNVQVLKLVILAIFATAGAFLVQTYAQDKLDPVKVASILNLEPLFGLIFALTIPDNNGQTEHLTVQLAVGGILLLIAMFIAENEEKELL
jgi:drug/metabolite transporter (DMT)-like permease